ncbi:MAG: hypothetical protein F6J86_38610 [Symploca sp. SIO1B1]|nr:hypothetical protein [Symploca sp. SIO1B1]
MTKKSLQRTFWLLIQFLLPELLALLLEANVVRLVNLCFLLWQLLRDEE